MTDRTTELPRRPKPDATIRQEFYSGVLKRFADRVDGSGQQRLALSRRKTVSGLTPAAAASSRMPIPRAARAILHCVAAKFAGAVHIPGELVIASEFTNNGVGERTQPRSQAVRRARPAAQQRYG
jgi:hypothetical protein